MTVVVPVAAVPFIFGQVQKWVDSLGDPTNQSLMVWLFPGAVSIIYVLAVLTVLAVMAARQSTLRQQAAIVGDATTLATAVLHHIQELSSTDRDDSIIKLRNRISGYLHAQGNNKERMAMGELALGAAIAANDKQAQIEILIDDIGWSAHMLRDDTLALKNISRGIDIAQEVVQCDPFSNIALLLKKGYRHSAIIKSANNLTSALEDLRLANDALDAYHSKHGETQQFLIERAQLMHGEALCITVSLRLQDTGEVSPTDSKGAKLVERALACCSASVNEFRELGEYSRYVKALKLHQRLLRSVRRDMEADEIEEILKRVVRKSLWNIERAEQNIKGV